MLCNFLHFQAHCFMKFSDDTWLVNNHALLKEIILFPSVKNTPWIPGWDKVVTTF